MNLIDVARELATDEECFAFLESQRWPDGVRCVVCGCDRISRITRKAPSKNKRANLYQCLEPTCKQQFSVTSGTIFHDARVPLSKWFMAISLVMDAKKGLSAKQLQRHLGLGSYQTAWHMAHRIREAMGNPPDDPEQLTGTVEMDETYLGGKTQGRDWRRRKVKQVVVGMKQRGGKLRLMHTPDAKIETLAECIREHVSADVEAIMTDELPAYPKALRISGHDEMKHKTVNHSAQIYVDGDVTTNGIESAFSLFKRGVIGSFHKISIKHLHRYLSEFEFRFNERKNGERFEKMVSMTAQTSPLTYRRLVDGIDPVPF
jgi:transposase-like protein